MKGAIKTQRNETSNLNRTKLVKYFFEHILINHFED